MNQIQSYFDNADRIVKQFDTHVSQLTNPLDHVPYTGMIAITAIAAYELSIKYTFSNFATKKHKIFGEFTRNSLNRINGNIKRNELQKYIKRFGEKYLIRFNKNLDKAEMEYLRANRVSIKEAYHNIIQMRHQFAHECKLPSTSTYEEAKTAYNAGKILIITLYNSMKR